MRKKYSKIVGDSGKRLHTQTSPLKIELEPVFAKRGELSHYNVILMLNNANVKKWYLPLDDVDHVLDEPERLSEWLEMFVAMKLGRLLE